MVQIRWAMVKIAVGYITLLILFSIKLHGSLTTDQATQTAKQIWSTSGFARHVGRNFQVGCIVAGQTIIVSDSKISFEDAFANVNMKTNGLHILTADAYANNGEIATSPAVPIYLCNP